MRTCPQCGARYEAPAQFCQRDGTSLHDDVEARDPYLGARILGQFRVERVLGTGGMGTVYAAWDEALGRQVAVKILHRELVTNRDVVQRFQREAQIAHQLDHPNIVRLILFGQLPDGNLYLVLEYLEGPTLAAAIESANGPMDPARAVKILGAVCDAIGYAHRRDIVHRDLKPENVILVRRDDDAEHPKVLDFGIAKVLAGSHDTQATQAGLIFGTAKYISPEGAQGERVDKRSDVYSLGVIAYQMLAGRPPFDATEPVQLLLKHMQENPVALRRVPGTSRVSAALEAVVMRALAKNPEARVDDAQAFGRALREAVFGPAVAAERSATSSSPVVAAARPSFTTASMGTFGAEGTPLANQAASDPFTPPTPAVGTATAAALASMHFAPGAPPSSVPQSGPYPAVPASNPGGIWGSEPSNNNVFAPPHAYPSGASASVVAARSPENSGLVSASPSVVVQAPPAMAEAPYTGPAASTSDPGYAVGTASTVRDEYALGASHPGGARGDGPDDDDELIVPGLGRRSTSASGSRTTLLVIATAVITLLLGAGLAWALGMYPSQRQEAQLQSLLARAGDAMQAGRYVHDRAGDDVEDLTDAVLAISPRHPRALELRAAASRQLRNAAVEAHNAGRTRQAVPLVYQARRLADDTTELDGLLRTFEQTLQPAADAGAPSAQPSAPSARPGPNSPRDPRANAPANTAPTASPRPASSAEPTPRPTANVEPAVPSATPTPQPTVEVPVFTPHPPDPTAAPTPTPEPQPTVIQQPPPVVQPQPEDPPQENYGFQ